MNLAEQLNIDTKGMVVVNEYVKFQQDFRALVSIVKQLARNDQEREPIIEKVGEQLLALGYSPADADRCVTGLRQALGPAAPANPVLGLIRPGPGAPAPSPPRPVPPAPPPRPAPERPAGPSSPSVFEQAQQPRPSLLARREKDPARTHGAPARPASPQAPPAAPAKPVVSVRPIGAEGSAPLGEMGRRLGQKLYKPIILFADNNQQARLMRKLELEEAGYLVEGAANGTEAWKKIKAGEYDGIVLDTRLTGIAGMDLLARMNRKKIVTPVVMVTNFSRAHEQQPALLHPQIKCVMKPVSAAQIVALLADLGCAPGRDES